MNTQQLETSSIKQDTHECDFHDCHATGEHRVHGVAWLCTVHFLCDRVRLNLMTLRGNVA